MMNQPTMNGKPLNVGDEVAIVESGGHWGQARVRSYHRVAKINHHGHIVLEGTIRQFDKNLSERSVKGSYNSKSFLWDANISRAYVEHKRELTDRAVTLRVMSEQMKMSINGYGEAAPLDEKVKAEWIAKIQAL